MTDNHSGPVPPMNFFINGKKYRLPIIQFRVFGDNLEAGGSPGLVFCHHCLICGNIMSYLMFRLCTLHKNKDIARKELIDWVLNCTLIVIAYIGSL